MASDSDIHVARMVCSVPRASHGAPGAARQQAYIRPISPLHCRDARPFRMRHSPHRIPVEPAHRPYSPGHGSAA